jgi:hypothetical protein
LTFVNDNVGRPRRVHVDDHDHDHDRVNVNVNVNVYVGVPVRVNVPVNVNGYVASTSGRPTDFTTLTPTWTST